MKQRSFSAKWWNRLGIATTRDAASDAAHVKKRLERHAEEERRLHQMLDKQQVQAAATMAAVKELGASLEKVQESVRAVGDQIQRVALARKQDLASMDGAPRLRVELEGQAAGIETHVEAALARSGLVTDPFPHVVVDALLPPPFYNMLLDALPPADYWRSSGLGRDYWEIDSDVAPWRTEVVWQFVDQRVVDDVVRPRALQMFGRELARYWQESFNLDPARVKYHTAEGRLQLRRKGYRLRAHLDPPHAALTGLFYLARPADDPQYGTVLYKALAPLPVKRKGIYYPEDHDIALESVATVPFRANTLLLWMTPVGPHGADLTAAAVPPSIKRYSYQFQFVVDDETRRRLKAK